jgi:putative toxin-antitoxin system antitoxin component (TIGR02293 family)
MTLILKEASAQYLSRWSRIPEDLHLDGEVVRRLIGKSPQAATPAELIAMINQGISFSEFEDLQACLEVTKIRMAELLNISKATLHRREAARGLQPDESDRLVRFARLLGRAVDVFESLDGARRWLKAPQYGLGEAIPLEYAKTDVGAREVELLLGRIEHGVYS